jgi:DNA-binding NtrC family response regulator
LENAVERAVVVGKGRQIKLCDLPFIAAGGTAETGELSLEELEPQDIAQLLAAKGSTISPVARVLRINCSTLYEKIKKYGLAT